MVQKENICLLIEVISMPFNMSSSEISYVVTFTSYMRIFYLRPAARYAILRIEIGKAIEAATPQKQNLIYIRPSLLGVMAAISFP